jgi:predicted aspartyl protease
MPGRGRDAPTADDINDLARRPPGCDNGPVGNVFVPVELKTAHGRSRVVQMLVDSGAVWSCLPEEDWQALGLSPQRRCQFDLADGSIIERDVSECVFRYGDVEATSPVILGEKDDVALLGAVTLETLALVLNPYKRTLSPMALRLMAMQKNGNGPLFQTRYTR